MEIRVTCEKCGKEFMREKCMIKEHVFCSRACAREYLSRKMSRMNKERNPDRMRPETREKISQTRKKGAETKDNIYIKTMGRHEHRRVAEQMLGRPLRPGEVVHHIDHDRHNNSPENLMIFSSQAEHAAYHARKEAQDDL